MKKFKSSAAPEFEYGGRRPRQAVLYLRIARSHHLEGAEDDAALAAQLQICLNVACLLGADVVDHYVDCGESGVSSSRPGLADLRERMRNSPDIDYVIIAQHDRLARSYAQYSQLVSELTMHGARVALPVDELPHRPVDDGSAASPTTFPTP